jgi:hypothetical protein
MAPRDAQPKRRRTSDRYNLTDASEPPAGRGRVPRSRNAFTAVVAVEDPIADCNGRRGRLLATVNRRVDVLEYERSHDRITDRAYTVGRIVQAVFERARGPGAGSQWREGDRVDAVVAQELAIIRAIQGARLVQVYLKRIREAIGRIDANLLKQILGDHKSYGEVAALRGRANRAGTAYFADRFRDALEDLGETWERRR